MPRRRHLAVSTADVIVIGLGAFGSAVLYQLAARGVRVLGIDRFDPPHEQGSSHGETRITRQAVAEGAVYVPLVARSHAIWRRLEAETGRSLLCQVGGLFMGDGPAHGVKFVAETMALAQRFHIPHEILGAAEINRRFPQFRVPGDIRGYYEPGAGYLRPEECVAAQLSLAQTLGADIHTGETILRVEQQGSAVTVVTGKQRYAAPRVVVAMGAWLPRFFAEAYGGRLEVLRQSQYWFEPSSPELWSPERCPVFMWLHGAGPEDFFYGFPRLPGSRGIKLATEQLRETTTPDLASREVTEAESRALYADHIAGRLLGVTPSCLRATTCFYTVAKEFRFVVQDHPDSDRITVISACSGHGFKHSAAIGEAVAELLVDGRSALDLSPFRNA